MTVRPMTYKDIPTLITLGADMHKESRYSHLDFQPTKLMELGEMILSNPDTYFTLVYDDGEIKGFVIGYIYPHFFGNDLTSGDLAVYVLPEHRKGRVGIKLIVAYAEHCKKLGVKEPVLGVSAGVLSEKVGKLYERLGFTDKFQVYRMPSL